MTRAKAEWALIKQQFGSLDKQVVMVLVAVAVLQTISWYLTSRRFFRFELLPTLQGLEKPMFYEFAYWFVGDFTVFFILPVLLILFVHKKKPKEFGVTFGDYKTGLPITAVFLLFMMPILWISSGSAQFTLFYPHLYEAKTDWSIFLVYETGMLLYMIAWEFVWRGYMLFGLKERFGHTAVFIQMIPFVILHNGKPAAETFSSIAGGIILGMLAWRTGSFIYCAITHFGIMFIIDLFASLRFRSGDYGIGVQSFINALKQLW